MECLHRAWLPNLRQYRIECPTTEWNLQTLRISFIVSPLLKSNLLLLLLLSMLLADNNGLSNFTLADVEAA